MSDSLSPGVEALRAALLEELRRIGQLPSSEGAFAAYSDLIRFLQEGTLAVGYLRRLELAALADSGMTNREIGKKVGLSAPRVNQLLNSHVGPPPFLSDLGL